jgi:hypothetical protein
MMLFVLSKSDNLVNGRMSLKQRRNLLIQHKMDLRLREIMTEGIEQRSGENSVAHLPETYDEYIHGVVGIIMGAKIGILNEN